MTEHDNIIDVLKDLFELSDAKDIKVNGKIATVEDLQEFYKESLVNLADLLGVSELYLK